MPAVAAPRAPEVTSRGSQTAIPCLFMRGGTSRGPFFDARRLPDDPGLRNAVLLAVMGSPDPRQIDGIGGAHPLTSKIGLVRPATDAANDLEWTFAQVQPGGKDVDTSSNCGNMLAAVLPFAVETGMVTPTGDRTTARVLTRNTGMVAEITVDTPAAPSGERYVSYEGPVSIDGVPGGAAPIEIAFLDTAGSVAGSLLPTGRVRDTVEVPGTGSVDVTLIDNGQPLAIVAAERLGATGYETPEEIDADEDLRARVEALRLVCGEAMGLGDVTERNYPKMTLVAPPRDGGILSTRSLIPRVCHQSIGVLAAVTAATASVLEGTVAHDVAAAVSGTEPTVRVEHPSGALDVILGRDPDDPRRVTRSALLRTARLLMAGDVLVPRSVWDPAPTAQEKSS
ncbi:4-oxalomesaconate tautomerase [Streptomyces sp. BpilaLS-43]|uniref:4-oxalomesaconate tautomerase n=1 Tax=Streptomyces sp. BpilaLS-43 TaxID=1839778 RepID=UPI00081B0FFE|nr:4-oxalomesaconate tautomerase [Streptomyces sp. BpilaLS-43]SCD55024.1 4-oxalomesaconate tautomerase [Streptomyces sp. BpilaLS-43]